MNKVILIGNLTDDPKTSVTANGVTKCTFRLATQRKYTNPQTGQPGGGYAEQDGFVPVDDEDLPF